MTAPAATGTEELFAQFQDDTVFIKNTQPGPAVFTTDATKADGHIVWQGVGDPNGQDVQVVPRTVLASPQIRKMFQLGIFQVVEDPEIQAAALVAQQQAWSTEKDRRDNPNPEAIFNDPTLDTKQQLVVEGAEAQKDLHIESCLAQPCQTSVTLKTAEVGVKPPLCNTHAYLAAAYVPQEDETKPLVNGKPPVRWVRPSVGNPVG